MKHRYRISFDADNHELWIKEYAEVERDHFSLLCEERFAVETVEETARAGKAPLIQMLRTKHMYPPAPYSDKIADAIIAFLAKDDTDTVELNFDDKAALAEAKAASEAAAAKAESGGDTSAAVDKRLA
jgi:hypothetical protein